MKTPVSFKLQKWFETNKRELPWRNTKDAYRIWLSEIILQQTRVDQGLPYYQKFIQHYPTVYDLAQSTEDEVLKLWQGLGYYSRGRNLLKCARMVVDQYQGNFPDNYKEIKSLPGIGDYTASAVLSFAYTLPYAVLDGNVYRFLSRLFGEHTVINTPKGNRLFKALADEIIDQARPDLHNQAIMEFGALHCTPKSPKCNSCPFETECLAYRTGKVELLPVKMKPKPRKKRYFNYIIPSGEKTGILIRQRDNRDIWAGLYEFPMIETETAISEDIFSHLISDKIDCTAHHIIRHSEKKHILSHQEIYAVFWIVHTSSFRFPINWNIFEVDIEELNAKYAMPVLLTNFLDKLRLTREDVY